MALFPREQPIITSDAIISQPYDWMGLQFTPGSTGELERVQEVDMPIWRGGKITQEEKDIC